MIIKPETVYIGEKVKIHPSATVMPYCVILGETRIGADTVICSFSHIDQSTIGENCTIGPYARLRCGCVIGDGCRIGNFVEIKNSRLGNRVKTAHLAYIGDATLGNDCNVGCGAIFCNYDGSKKHESVVGDRCFIGSNVNLIAPIKLGDDCFVSAGTTLSDSLPPNTFAKSTREIRTSFNLFSSEKKKDKET